MITLRPFREDELGYFDVVDPAADPYNFFGFRLAGEKVERWRRNGLIEHQAGGTLAVDLDGQVIGDVGWHPFSYGPPSAVPPAFNIGITLVTAQRGKGYGSLAQRQLGDHLFAVYAVHRLEASTDVSNVAEQRALVKAGFTREGVLRGAQFRAGRFRDLVGYSRLRDDNPDAST